MSILNKTCVICSDKYSYCPSCGKDRNKPSWMASFCSENCKKIYDIVARYGMNKVDISEAIEVLNTCDLSNKDHFTTSTQRLIDEIYRLPKEACAATSECSEDESEAVGAINMESDMIDITESTNADTELKSASEVVPMTHKINYKKKKKHR